MNIQIELASGNPEADVDAIVNLKQRLSDNLDPSAEVKQQEAPLSPDDAAAGVLTALINIIVGRKFAEGITGIIRDWIRSRPAITEAKATKLVVIIEEKGKKTSVKIENIKDLEQVKSFIDSL